MDQLNQGGHTLNHIIETRKTHIKYGKILYYNNPAIYGLGNDSVLKKILRGADSYNVVYIEIVRYGSLFLDRLLNEGNFRMQINVFAEICTDLQMAVYANSIRHSIMLINIVSTIYNDYILGFY
jgi:hypothetical protein